MSNIKTQKEKTIKKIHNLKTQKIFLNIKGDIMKNIKEKINKYIDERLKK